MKRRSLFLLVFTTLLASCGLGGLTAGVSNDPLPTGTIVSQGSFGANSNAVSGFVSVYKQDCTTVCNFVVRIQNLNSSTSANVQVVASGNNLGSPSLSSQLRLATGSQNFPFTAVPSNAVFSSVALHPGAYPIGQNDYAIAALTAP